MWKKVEGVSRDGRKVLLECSGTDDDPHDPVRKWVFEPSWKNGTSKSCGCLTKREATKRSESNGLSAIPPGTVFGRWEVLQVLRASDLDPGAKPTVKVAKVRCAGSVSSPHDPVERYVHVSNLKQGLSTSCGCAANLHGLAQKNGKRHPLYHIWNGVVSRTQNPSDRAYANYGGRGITLSEEFLDPRAFVDYISSLPNFEHREPQALQLDRADNSKGYERGNLRWVTAKVNSSNKRTNHVVLDTLTNVKALASQIAKDAGKFSLYHRKHVLVGLPADEALNIALNSPNRFIYVNQE